jgi:uncharacterized membrane protein YphA (DoxX/SURF4 family)
LSLWGSLLVGLALWGPGRWSLDHWVGKRFDAASRERAMAH